MRIGAITPGSVASSVWSQATRTLTSIVGGVSAFGTTNTLANGSVLDLRPTASKFRLVSFWDITAVANVLTGIYDGATFTGVAPGAATDVTPMFGGSSTGPAAKNSNGAGITYAYSGFDLG